MNNIIDFPCPVCNSNNLAERYQDTLGNNLPAFDYNFSPLTQRHYRIVKCLNCSHCFSTPRHQNIYANYSANKADDIYISLSPQRFATDAQAIKSIVELCPQGKLLDIGCATGDFLITAREYYEAEGLDLSEWASKIARDRGLTIHTCLIRELPYSEHYDVITLWGVIEHFEFPKEEVINMRKILKKKGIVCIWTGDISSVTARIMGKKWHYFHGQHIQMFSKKSLRRMFIDCGFEEVTIKTYPYILTMTSLSNTLTRYPLIHKMMSPIISHKALSNKRLILKLPGEMFAMFRKR
jgi:ubiquinone/menaquinone biosynthesis C-methylase UbiE